jgi:malate/lactate dehydrogenase
MGVTSDGSYGIQAGLIYSFPVYIKPDHTYTIVPNLPIDSFARQQMDATLQELVEERDSAETSCNE